MPAVKVDHTSLIEASRKSLDWPRLVEALAARAATSMGRELCQAPPLASDAHAVRRRLRQVTQMRALMLEKRVPLGGVPDVRQHLVRCTKGEVLDGRQLLEVADVLASISTVRQYFDGRECPDLWAFISNLVPLPELQSRLSASFDKTGELSTVTYPHLAEMRGRKAKLHTAIKGQLADLVEDEAWGSALQDDFMALRNDRYVLPVKAQARSMDLGIVHDTSGTGQTIFVEPREIVGLNNRLKMADAELQREERAILISLCEAVTSFARDIHASLELVARIDAVVARARLAGDLDASEPTVEDGGVELFSARHPLLVLRGLEVVPNDLRLGGDRRAMILSGPNAGGKTVTLKTLGLCALMVRAGMHLPVAAGSRIALFPHVLTDIGDLQSVEADLSTFSGHLLTLRRILELLQEGADDTLVLIDEIAVGTDPQQGAALAAAVLQAVLDRGALAVSTTHFASLKALAEVDSRFVNGRLEFDAEALTPSFRLSTGSPGRSYAFDIARQLGLPAEIIEAAESRLEPSHREVEALLSSLEQERGAVRKQRQELEQGGQALEKRTARLALKEKELARRRESLQEDLIDDFDREVEGYRQVVKGLVRELRKAPSMAAAERARRRIASGGRSLREKLASRAGGHVQAAEAMDLDGLQVGDPLRLLMGDRECVLSALPDARGRVEVQVGNARVRCTPSDLGPSRRAPARKPAAPPPAHTPKKRSASAAEELEAAVRTAANTLDLRGKRVDEAFDEVDRFLDDASLRGDNVVFVLHGFGTGALRKAIREHLAGSPYVVASGPARDSQGGDAFTAILV